MTTPDKLVSTARQALEDAYQEDSDDEDTIDDTKLLNLNEDEGMPFLS